MNRPFLLLLISLFHANLAFSQLFDGKTQAETTLANLVETVKPGSILILGENHGLASHRDQHVAILNKLREAGLKVSVGLEFINYTDQQLVNQYREGFLSEPAFLSSINWKGISYDFYKQQLNFPDISAGEKSLGLNLPRSVTSQISKFGLNSLSASDLLLVPPDFSLGRDSYKTRFMEAAGAHCKVPDNCFAAQCAWDVTMAWQAFVFAERHPDQVLVIVVGEFHVQYGGGLPHRILQRLPGAHIVTLSQVWAEGYTDEEIQQELQPSFTEGPRADFIWVSKP